MTYYQNMTYLSEKLILRAQHRVYEQSVRMGKLLARQIREAETSRMIPQLRFQSGTITINYKEIHSGFKLLYYFIFLKIPTRCFCNELVS